MNARTRTPFKNEEEKSKKNLHRESNGEKKTKRRKPQLLHSRRKCFIFLNHLLKNSRNKIILSNFNIKFSLHQQNILHYYNRINTFSILIWVFSFFQNRNIRFPVFWRKRFIFKIISTDCWENLNICFLSVVFND